MGDVNDIDAWGARLLREPGVDAERFGRALRVIRTHYTRWGCAILASALARANPGLKVARLRDGGAMGHAAVVVGRQGNGHEFLLCADVAGVWTVADLRREYTHPGGRLSLSIGGPSASNPAVDEPDEAPLAIAGRLPWLSDLVPERFREADPAAAAADLIDLGERLRASHADGAIMDRQGDASIAFCWLGPWLEERERKRSGTLTCR